MFYQASSSSSAPAPSSTSSAPASSTVLLASCASTAIDPTTGQCTSVQWVSQSAVSVFPPLTATQGVVISGAIGTCWALGFLVRVFRRQLGVS